MYGNTYGEMAQQAIAENMHRIVISVVYGLAAVVSAYLIG